MDFCARLVLNASRHHWYFHVEPRRTQHLLKLCSTPRGITGTFTIDGPRSLLIPQVLNASRHHWYFHYDDSLMLTPVMKCSTPCGITGTFTRQMSKVLQPSECAQRLAASLVLSQRPSRSSRIVLDVLNASRHHWYFHRSS